MLKEDKFFLLFQNFSSNSNLRMLGASAAAVTVMTLILSRGNFIAAIGAGIGTAASSYVINRHLFKKAKFLKEKLDYLLGVLEVLEKTIKSSNEQANPLMDKNAKSKYSNKWEASLKNDIESLKDKLKNC